MSSPLASLESFARFVAEHPLSVIATVDGAGSPQAALVQVTTTRHGDLVFNALATSRKIANIGARPDVAVVVGCTGDETVQVEGTAVIESGDARDAVAADYVAAFPDSRTGDEVVFVRIRPRWGRFYGLAGPQVLEGRPPWVDAGG